MPSPSISRAPRFRAVFWPLLLYVPLGSTPDAQHPTSFFFHNVPSLPSHTPAFPQHGFLVLELPRRNQLPLRVGNPCLKCTEEDANRAGCLALQFSFSWNSRVGEVLEQTQAQLKLHQALHAHLSPWPKASPKGCLIGGLGASPIVQWTGRAETWPRVWPQDEALGAICFTLGSQGRSKPGGHCVQRVRYG